MPCHTSLSESAPSLPECRPVSGMQDISIKCAALQICRQLRPQMPPAKVLGTFAMAYAQVCLLQALFLSLLCHLKREVKVYLLAVCGSKLVLWVHSIPCPHDNVALIFSWKSLPHYHLAADNFVGRLPPDYGRPSKFASTLWALEISLCCIFYYTLHKAFDKRAFPALSHSRTSMM